MARSSLPSGDRDGAASPPERSRADHPVVSAPACAGIEGAQDLDRLEQRLAAGGGLERQGEEGAAGIGAACHSARAWHRDGRAPPAARRPGTPWPPRSGPGRSPRIAERADGLSAIGRDQRIDGAEHAVQPVAGAAAQDSCAAFRPKCATGGSCRSGTGRSSRRSGRAASCAPRPGSRRRVRHAWAWRSGGDRRHHSGVRAAPSWRTILRIELIQSAAGAEQFLDQAQADDVALDHRGVGGFWIVLEPEQAGPCIALRHFHQQVDAMRAVTSGRRLGDRCRRARSWLWATSATTIRSSVLTLGNMTCHSRSLSSARVSNSAAVRPSSAPCAQPVAQVGLRRLLVEAAQAEITANALCLRAFRRLAARTGRGTAPAAVRADATDD